MVGENDHVTGQNTYNANGKTLVGDPFTYEQIYKVAYDSSGSLYQISAVGTGQAEKVLLPDGSVFYSAGRIDYLSPAFMTTTGSSSSTADSPATSRASAPPSPPRASPAAEPTNPMTRKARSGGPSTAEGRKASAGVIKGTLQGHTGWTIGGGRRPPPPVRLLRPRASQRVEFCVCEAIERPVSRAYP